MYPRDTKRYMRNLIKFGSLPAYTMTWMYVGKFCHKPVQYSIAKLNKNR